MKRRSATPHPKGAAGLSHSERLQLMRFVCATVWADLEVSRSEKSYVLALALRLGLSEADIAEVRRWIEQPPAPDEVDPAQIPLEHRQIFLEVIEETMEADQMVAGPERESLALLRELLRDAAD